MKDEILDLNSVLNSLDDERYMHELGLNPDSDAYFEDDDFEDEEETKPKKRGRKSKNSEKAFHDDGKSVEKVDSNSVSSFIKHAKSIVKRFIENNPINLQIKQQLEVLTKNMTAYKKAGNMEAVSKCNEEIQKLITQQKKYENILNGSKPSEDTNERIKNSKKIKEINQRLKELQEEYKLLNTNSLITELNKLRSVIDDTEDVKYLVNSEEESDYDEDDLQELDDFLDEKSNNRKTDTEEKLEELYSRISEITDTPIATIEEMQTNVIKTLLNNSDKERREKRLEEIKEEKSKLYIERNNETRKIRGYNDITDVMYEIFDYEELNTEPKEEEEQKIKNLLASNYANFVVSLAYKECARKNMLHNLNDAIGFGNVGLSEALNKWLSIQKLANGAFSFIDFAYTYISNSIKKNLLVFSNTGGMITATNYATVKHREREALENIKGEIRKLCGDKLNDLFTEEQLDSYAENLLGSRQYKLKHGKLTPITSEDYEKEKELNRKIKRGGIIGKVNSATDIEAHMSGDSEGNVDVFNFTNSFEGRDADDIVQAENIYVNVINGLHDIFELFEEKEKKNKKTGEIQHVKTNTKLFDKADYEIFKLYFGFTKLVNSKDGELIVEEKQKEEAIAQYLFEKKILISAKTNGPVSQSAINYRKKILLDKIRVLKETNPNVKQTFEYLMYMIQANPNAFRQFTGTIDLDTGNKKIITDKDKFDEAKFNSVKLDTILVDELDDDDELIDKWKDMMSY